MRCLAVVASLLLAACPSPDDGPAVDAGCGDDDGGGEGRGLTITFALDTDFPVTTGDGTIIDRIELRANRVRAIGDAAPGDERTTRLQYRMRWDGSDRPEAIRFESAPVGLYSAVDVQLSEDGDSSSIEIDGECTRNGSRVDFEIESDEPLSISIPVNEMLAPGESASIDISVAIGAVVDNIDWSAHPLDGDGDVSITDSSSSMPSILAALRASFGAAATTAR